MVHGQGEMQTTEFGAKREANDGRGRFDLLPFEAIEALAKWSEEGAVKYGDRNWEDGLSVKDCINRMIRHAIKAANGWTDEDHLAAVMWNAGAAITMIQRRPDCNDHKWRPVVNNKLVGNRPSHIIYDEQAFISDEDRIFLTKAIESGGINDLKTLSDWINRRI